MISKLPSDVNFKLLAHLYLTQTELMIVTDPEFKIYKSKSGKILG